MKNNLFKIKATLTLFLISYLSFASPDGSGGRNRIILLGTNKTNFYCLKMIKPAPQTYYVDIDSLFLEERNINSGKLISKVFIRIIERIDTTTFGNWVKYERVNKSFDLAKYMIKKNINPIYEASDDISKEFTRSFNFSNKGLFLNYGNKKELIADEAYMAKYISGISYALAEANFRKNDKYSSFTLRVTGTYRTDANDIFLMIEDGESEDFLEHAILVIHHDKYNQAYQKIWERLKKKIEKN